MSVPLEIIDNVSDQMALLLLVQKFAITDPLEITVQTMYQTRWHFFALILLVQQFAITDPLEITV